MTRKFSYNTHTKQKRNSHPSQLPMVTKHGDTKKCSFLGKPAMVLPVLAKSAKLADNSYQETSNIERHMLFSHFGLVLVGFTEEPEGK